MVEIFMSPAMLTTIAMNFNRIFTDFHNFEQIAKKIRMLSSDLWACLLMGNFKEGPVAFWGVLRVSWRYLGGSWRVS